MATLTDEKIEALKKIITKQFPELKDIEPKIETREIKPDPRPTSGIWRDYWKCGEDCLEYPEVHAAWFRSYSWTNHKGK